MVDGDYFGAADVSPFAGAGGEGFIVPQPIPLKSLLAISDCIGSLSTRVIDDGLTAIPQ